MPKNVQSYSTKHISKSKVARPVAGSKSALVWGEGAVVHCKVLENGKEARRNKHVQKMWYSKDMKLVFGPGISKSGLRCPKMLPQLLRSSKIGTKILISEVKIQKNNCKWEDTCSRHLGRTRNNDFF